MRVAGAGFHLGGVGGGQLWRCILHIIAVSEPAIMKNIELPEPASACFIVRNCR